MPHEASESAPLQSEQLHQRFEITPELAERINAHYDVQIFGGGHGSSVLNDEAVQSPLYKVALRSARTGDKEFDEAARVVKTLRPGQDTLFVEVFAHGGSLNTVAGALRRELRQDGISDLGPMSDLIENVVTGEIESSRQQQRLQAWEYGAELAALKGVEVLPADCTLDDEKQFEAEYGKSSLEAALSDDPADRAAFAAFERQRSFTARDTMLHWAIDNLPPDGTPPPIEKRKLALLFGKGHIEELREAFAEAGVECTITELDTAVEERAAVRRLAEEGPGGMMKFLGQEKGKTTTTPLERGGRREYKDRLSNAAVPQMTRRRLGSAGVGAYAKRLDSSRPGNEDKL